MSTDAGQPSVAGKPGPDLLIRAEVVHAPENDDTAVTLRLSQASVETMVSHISARHPVDPANVLGDIDAWHLRTEAGWHRFMAFLQEGHPAREYQCPSGGGDIIASAPGPVFGILSIGGPRRAGFNDGLPAFPFHVLAPADDVGGVGLEGTAAALPVTGFQRMTHATRDSALADTLLSWRAKAMRGLPLFLVRSETDCSATLSELGRGQAFENLLVAMDNLCASAAALGRGARLLAIGIDHSLEDFRSTSAEIVAGMRALMARIEREAATRGLQKPIFLAQFESGTTRIGDHPAIRAHWELAWSHRPHHLVFSAPGYMFAQRDFGRPTEDARIRMAEMDAHALTAVSDRKPWFCPLFLLAEAEGPKIRVTAQALSDLYIDPSDPFVAGPSCGFSLSGSNARILSVAVAANDARALILTCDKAPGDGVELHYAHAAAPRLGDFPANRGSIRDLWSAESRTSGGLLHRWAYPAVLAVRGTGQAQATVQAVDRKPAAEKVGGAGGRVWFRASNGRFDPVAGDLNRATGWHSTGGQVARAVASNRDGTAVAKTALKFVAEVNSGLVLAGAVPDLRAFSLGLIVQAPEGDARTLLSLQRPEQSGYLFIDMLGSVVRLAERGGGLLLEVPLEGGAKGPKLVLCGISGGMARLSLNGSKPALKAMNQKDDQGAADLFIGCRGARTGLRNKLGSFLLSDVMLWPDRDCLSAPDDPDAAWAIALWREGQTHGV